MKSTARRVDEDRVEQGGGGVVAAQCLAAADADRREPHRGQGVGGASFGQQIARPATRGRLSDEHEKQVFLHACQTVWARRARSIHDDRHKLETTLRKYVLDQQSKSM